MTPALARSAAGVAFQQFRRNYFARIGAVTIACIALAALFADVLASDLPIACRSHGKTYLFPALVHPVGLAGEDNASIDRDRSPGDWAIHPFVRFGASGTATRGEVRSVQAPALFGEHPLGTDAYGRDVFARLVHGARVSLGVSLFAALALVTVGTVLGALAGFFGGAIDGIVSRLVETLTAFPTLVLVLVVQALLEDPTMLSLLIAIGLTRWPEVARLVRAEVSLAATNDYVVAARALGAGPWRVLSRHVAPNVLAPVLVSGTLSVASVVLIEASLDFLHVGIPAASASWGEMLSETREHVGAWWLLLFPGIAVFVTVMSLNLVGEALRDALDPRLRAATRGGGESGPKSAPGSGDAPPSSLAFDEAPHT